MAMCHWFWLTHWWERPSCKSSSFTRPLESKSTFQKYTMVPEGTTRGSRSTMVAATRPRFIFCRHRDSTRARAMPRGTEITMNTALLKAALWNREFVRVSEKFFSPTNSWDPMLSMRA